MTIFPALGRCALGAAFAVIPGGTQAQGPDRLDELDRRLARIESRIDALLGDRAGATATDAATRLAWSREHVAMQEQSRFADAKWQFLGPTRISGRVTDVAVPTPRGATYTIYVATASGGVWRSINEGTTWVPIFEHAASTSIGDIALSPAEPDALWVGTGEANIFRSSMAGAGIYKSADRGATWRHLGLASTHTIARIRVHPTDPDTVYVAASGHEWTPNPERGVFKTTDGGAHWDRVLFVDDETGAIDLVVDPRDPEVLYAATWERTRRRWNDPRNGPDHRGSAIYKTVDGGRSWRPINAGLPDPRHRGRIGIDLCHSRPDVLYALLDNYQLSGVQPEGTDSYGRPLQEPIKGAEVYRSDDAGATWRKASPSDAAMRRHSSTYGWVFGQIRVDPNDPDLVYTMGIRLHVSRDGGATFATLRGMHGDHHALWIDPDNSQYLINGNDGGVNVSYDGGASWRLFVDQIPVVQFYNVAYDMAEPFRIYGSVQDHGSYRAVVDIDDDRARIRGRDWERAPGGEASTHAVDPTDPHTVYSAGFYGRITRTDMRTGDRARIAPRAARGEPALRGQWLAPFMLSPHNPRIVYHGMNFLFRSMDRGDRFEKISPDLTGNDPEQLGDIPFQTLFAISESPLRFGLLYTGSDDGRVFRSRDSGGSWSEITAGLAPARWIARIEASRFDESTVYLAQNGKRHDDFTPYLWRSVDYGETWQSITDGIPSGPINVVREDPVDPQILYVGTDLGVYVTDDGARSWHTLGSGLPTTYVHDLQVHPRDAVLIAATHGRGMYALDVLAVRGDPVDGVADAGADADGVDR